MVSGRQYTLHCVILSSGIFEDYEIALEIRFFCKLYYKAIQIVIKLVIRYSLVE